MATGIESDGLEEFISRFENAANILEQETTDALSAAGNAFVDDAQGTAPVDTGHLRDSIIVTSSSNTEVIIEAQADYSRYVEEGTWKMSAQPFFFQAADSAKQEMEQRMSGIQL